MERTTLTQLQAEQNKPRTIRPIIVPPALPIKTETNQAETNPVNSVSAHTPNQSTNTPTQSHAASMVPDDRLEDTTIDNILMQRVKARIHEQITRVRAEGNQQESASTNQSEPFNSSNTYSDSNNSIDRRTQEGVTNAATDNINQTNGDTNTYGSTSDFSNSGNLASIRNSTTQHQSEETHQTTQQVQYTDVQTNSSEQTTASVSSVPIAHTQFRSELPQPSTTSVTQVQTPTASTAPTTEIVHRDIIAAAIDYPGNTNKQVEDAIILAAAGLSAGQIASALRIPRATVRGWFSVPAFQKGINAAHEQFADDLIATHLVKKEVRVKRYANRLSLMDEIIDARAESAANDPDAPEEAHTGLLTQRPMIIGRGRDAQTVMLWEFDATLDKAMRETEKQLAVESGNYNDGTQGVAPIKLYIGINTDMV